ncbi:MULTISPECIES: class I SAM-dependent methyltransferase [unclassified Crossiella]|uniref:class I SAM-dependent methyltransferase n=1 Tax=unclassified Crossiella TaxID=2620835 RepID=UPI001FFE92C8|nr:MULTISPECIES: class I SAM-dependent methyltransferase [unclassified Crossiella]MCK2239288.1 class I SAM-dependent methyltransferase [Crossiella sp. S99.2]MCK2251142.1 class I SAM-dependent methyltransferase [Crossiella sp. S99.1]
MTDRYTYMAQYHELFALPYKEPTQRAVAKAVADCANGVLEMGAGTGLVTETIADASAGEVFAVEPAAPMRAVLMSRLARRPDLQRRVTVMPMSALEVRLPVRVDAVVLISMLLCFSPAERQKLWQVCADSLNPGGLLLQDRPEPSSAEAIPPAAGSLQVGRARYDIEYEGRPVREGVLRLSWSYRITVGDEPGIEEREEIDAYPVTESELDAELAAAGFDRADAPDDLLGWRLR